MVTLSKSKLLSSRQCAKRLWLEVHNPQAKEDSAATEQGYRTGNQVGDIARQIYDPKNEGALINAQVEGFDQAFARTQSLLGSSQPIFEAGFKAAGALAFADVLLPVKAGKQTKWRMVEVKSSASVKDYHHDDVAIQSFVAREAGVALATVSLAHIDNTFIYKGDGKYKGLLKEKNMDDSIAGRDKEIKKWIADAQKIIATSEEPDISTGDHCSTPFDCGFYDYCCSQEKQPKYPASWLPRVMGKTKQHLVDNAINDMRKVPDDILSEKQLRVKECTLGNKIYFNARAAAKTLSSETYPLYFLDFETINLTVPIWKNTRPFQQVPFQFSLHILAKDGSMKHHEFLDTSGKDPRQSLAEALIAYCGQSGTIYAYNAGFEKGVIENLAITFPKYEKMLKAIQRRIEDLLPITREHYYHPAMQGSWSIKAVLPSIAPELDYDNLSGVKEGGMAMEAFQEAIDPITVAERKEQIRNELLTYCKHDTYAMVVLWKYLSGKNEPGEKND